MKRLLALVIVSVIFCLCATPVFAQSEITRAWENWEEYQGKQDILYYIGIQRRNNAVTGVELNTQALLEGQNCINVSFDLNNKPGYATFWHEPDVETRGVKNLTTVNDGFKITMAADQEICVRVRLAFDWDDYQNDIWMWVGPEPKTYTVRWDDNWSEENQAIMAEATALDRIEMVIFGYCEFDDGTGYTNPKVGNFYFDDFCFFKGDDASVLDGVAIDIESIVATASETEAN